ncbi:biotin-dependent carboxyltransferase family protein (plasmid) [Pantoea sp. C3]|uniref:5-oxoprolinase subunit C family protein n=1 Tax=Pantoea phytostimulans TaxID=2769024 RepID=UPI0038F5F700
MIEILSGGALNLVQDTGRKGYMKLGISPGGAMDSMALSLANLLLGNPESSAVIEINIFPFRITFLSDTCFACTGGNSVIKLDDNIVAPWWRKMASNGQVLIIERPRNGTRVYLAFAGGIDVPHILGSASTDLKCAMGGVDGRGLKRGDILRLKPSSHAQQKKSLGVIPKGLSEFWREATSGQVKIKVLPGAEYHEFTAEALHQFCHYSYVITPQSNRLGYRLKGHPLTFSQKKELLSHGIVPGTIQVPPDGQPIIQLADANTCGGYPKIGTIIESDLWKVAQCPVGCQLRFEFIGLDEAIADLKRFNTHYTTLKNTLHLYS